MIWCMIFGHNWEAVFDAETHEAFYECLRCRVWDIKL